MKKNQCLAIIGSGASAIYLLKHLLTHANILKKQLSEISIIEQTSIMGMGMPYSPLNTDEYHMSNISSEELPELEVSWAHWMQKLDSELLRSLGVRDETISESEVYSRLALGRYLNSQYQALVGKLRVAGFIVHELPSCEVTDIKKSPDNDTFNLVVENQALPNFDQVVIATGHSWPQEDRPELGYYATPWPISKLVPEEGKYINFEVGTLGASLSAFDVVSSLSHRHGKFTEGSGKWSFTPHPGAENFKIIMHAANGMLPHLQFAQVNPMRLIYRHVTRERLMGLVDDSGFLRLDTFFDQVCRPALIDAFEKDDMSEMVTKLADPNFGLESFVETMSAKHDYANAFEGMRFEMVEAKNSVKNERPVHWKELMDDLIYTLNFHCELMPAEDHLKLKSVVMPFLMNVIAAMPLNSTNTILALYDAGKLDIISGRAKISDKQEEMGKTTVEVDDDGKKSIVSYGMFIDCTGQKPLELEEYPFPSLVKDGAVRKARASFAEPDAATDLPKDKKEHLFRDDGELVLHTGGVDIDGTYRLVGKNGSPTPGLHDIAFPHTSGVRPYSYGLQACSATSEIVVSAWVREIMEDGPFAQEEGPPTEIYEEISKE